LQKPLTSSFSELCHLSNRRQVGKREINKTEKIGGDGGDGEKKCTGCAGMRRQARRR